MNERGWGGRGSPCEMGSGWGAAWSSGRAKNTEVRGVILGSPNPKKVA